MEVKSDLNPGFLIEVKTNTVSFFGTVSDKRDG